jgi:hypothetical protein
LQLYNNTSGNTGSALGTGQGGKVNGLITVNSAEVEIAANGAPAVGDYRNVSGSITMNGRAWYSDNETFNSSIDIHRRYDDKEPEYTPLIIHTGTKANEAIHVAINDIHAEALGVKVQKVTPALTRLVRDGALVKAVEGSKPATYAVAGLDTDAE